MSEDLLLRIMALEEGLAKAMEILERTPLNDEMSTAVELCLKESEWFTDVIYFLLDIQQEVEEVRSEASDLDARVAQAESAIEDVKSEVEDILDQQGEAQ